MPAAGRSVAPAEHDVRVDLAPVTIERDVADQRKHLDLFPDRNTLVVLFFPVEVAKIGFAEGPDRGKAGGADALLLGEARQAGDRVFARGEDERERVAVPIQFLRFHGINGKHAACPPAPLPSAFARYAVGPGWGRME